MDPAFKEVLIRGLDDWVYLAELERVIELRNGVEDRDALRRQSLELVERLLAEGLVSIGALTKDGFMPWNVSVADAMARVDREWEALGSEIGPGDICWLENTSEGNQLASELEQRNSR